MISKRRMDDVLHYYGLARSVLPMVLGRPLGFFLYITGRCNLKCSYCWQREDEGRKDDWINCTRDELAPEEWVRVVEKLPKRSFIGLSGGECTISPAFGHILEAATRRSIPVTVNTNAAALTDKVVAKITAAKVRNVSISLDGFGDVHDAGRNMPGLFDRVVEGIGRLNAAKRGRADPSLTIKAVLLNENLDAMGAFRDFCASTLKAGTLNISLAKTGDHAQVSLKCTRDLGGLLATKHAALYDYRDPAKVERVLADLLADNKRSSCEVVLYPQLRTAAHVRAFLDCGGRSGYTACHLPRALCVVLPNGEMIPCLSYALGNVREHGYDAVKVLSAGPYQEFLKRMAGFGDKLPPACHVCCFARSR